MIKHCDSFSLQQSYVVKIRLCRWKMSLKSGKHVLILLGCYGRLSENIWKLNGLITRLPLGFQFLCFVSSELSDLWKETSLWWFVTCIHVRFLLILFMLLYQFFKLKIIFNILLCLLIGRSNIQQIHNVDK